MSKPHGDDVKYLRESFPKLEKYTVEILERLRVATDDYALSGGKPPAGVDPATTKEVVSIYEDANKLLRDMMSELLKHIDTIEKEVASL